MIKLIENNGMYLNLSFNQVFKIVLSVTLILMFFIIYTQHDEINILKTKTKIQNINIQRLEHRIKIIEYNME